MIFAGRLLSFCWPFADKFSFVLPLLRLLLLSGLTYLPGINLVILFVQIEISIGEFVGSLRLNFLKNLSLLIEV